MIDIDERSGEETKVNEQRSKEKELRLTSMSFRTARRREKRRTK